MNLHYLLPSPPTNLQNRTYFGKESHPRAIDRQDKERQAREVLEVKVNNISDRFDELNATRRPIHCMSLYSISLFFIINLSHIFSLPQLIIPLDVYCLRLLFHDIALSIAKKTTRQASEKLFSSST